MTPTGSLSRVHGLFNLVAGMWPLLHMRSFVAVTGPKTDYWLVRTVALLLVAIGSTQLSMASDGASAGRRKKGRRKETAAPERAAVLLGAGTAAGLGSIDLIYAGRRRISRIYLLDGVVELVWVALWLIVRGGAVTRRGGPPSERARV